MNATSSPVRLTLSFTACDATTVAIYVLPCCYLIPPGCCSGRRQNLKRVRPPGSVPSPTTADRGSMRYTFHGGGPCEGALNGAVMPDPLSSGSAGQPLSAHALARRAT